MSAPRTLERAFRCFGECKLSENFRMMDKIRRFQSFFWNTQQKTAGYQPAFIILRFGAPGFPISWQRMAATPSLAGYVVTLLSLGIYGTPAFRAAFDSRRHEDHNPAATGHGSTIRHVESVSLVRAPLKNSETNKSCTACISHGKTFHEKRLKRNHRCFGEPSLSKKTNRPGD